MSNSEKRRTDERESAEAKTLGAGVALLKPLLAEAGFSYRAGVTASASGGPFASGFFVRDTIEIGLIVRSECCLGAPSYSRGHGYAGHHGVLAALGFEELSNLNRPEYFSCSAKDGGDPFRSLFVDLRDLLLPVLIDTEENFMAAVDRASRKALDERRGRSSHKPI